LSIVSDIYQHTNRTTMDA